VRLLPVKEYKYELLEGELARVQTGLPAAKETPNIVREDMILNIRENWDYLNDAERMAFLHRFIKKIVKKVVKEQAKSNIVKIVGVEFSEMYVIPLVIPPSSKICRQRNLVDIKIFSL